MWILLEILVIIKELFDVLGFGMMLLGVDIRVVVLLNNVFRIVMGIVVILFFCVVRLRVDVDWVFVWFVVFLRIIFFFLFIFVIRYFDSFFNFCLWVNWLKDKLLIVKYLNLFFILNGFFLNIVWFLLWCCVCMMFFNEVMRFFWIKI